MNAVSIRGDWVGRTINGRFPLIAWLGGSGSAGVFLTEIAGRSQAPSDGAQGRRAAIKLIAASQQAEERLASWTRAATLSNPHLVRIFDTGRAEIDGEQAVYVVMELAEEVLAQIIPERALTSEETREMLGPVLDSLAYLHGKGYVHGHLRPSSILVVDNEVKLSSDGLLIAGRPAQEVFSSDLHNAPEISTGPVRPGADIWSLGVTLVEALSQQLPIWDAASDAEAEVPASLPAPFAEIVRKCLQADPARRCNLAEIRAMLEGNALLEAEENALPDAEGDAVPDVRRASDEPARDPVVHARKHPHKLAERTAPPKVPLVPLIIGFVLLVAIIVGLAMRSRKTDTAPVQTETTQQAPAAEPESRAASPPSAGQPPATGGSSPGEVIDRAMPDVPRAASNTIHGTVSVMVRVTVNETGAVSNAELASRGPSAYFARLAMESARNWKFKPAQQNGKPVASAWMLHYEFRRGSADVKPAQTEPK